MANDSNSRRTTPLNVANLVCSALCITIFFKAFKINMPKMFPLAIHIERLAEIAVGLSLTIQWLPIAEQYMVATQNWAELNLQETSDIYIAQGLFGFRHKDIRLDDHFERLLDDLTQFSMTSHDFEARDVAHHLLCSFVNKIDYNNNNGKNNRGILKNKIQ
uniref:Uncharacterized protein n=1 Tax=Glossina pallidipes TaxID=7398 RepID=A0A1B0A8C8_GLOPL